MDAIGHAAPSADPPPCADAATPGPPPDAPAAHADGAVFDACSRCVMEALRALRMMGSRHAAMLPMILPAVLAPAQGFKRVQAEALLGALRAAAAESPAAEAAAVAGSSSAARHACDHVRQKRGREDEVEGTTDCTESGSSQAGGVEQEPPRDPERVSAIGSAGQTPVPAVSKGVSGVSAVDLLKVVLSGRVWSATESTPAGVTLCVLCCAVLWWGRSPVAVSAHGARTGGLQSLAAAVLVWRRCPRQAHVPATGTLGRCNLPLVIHLVYHKFALHLLRNCVCFCIIVST